MNDAAPEEEQHEGATASMNSDPPPTYGFYRSAWSVLHVVIFALIFGVAAYWWLDDGRGAALTDRWYTWAQEVRYTVANLVPFPWET